MKKFCLIKHFLTRRSNMFEKIKKNIENDMNWPHEKILRRI